MSRLWFVIHLPSGTQRQVYAPSAALASALTGWPERETIAQGVGVKRHGFLTERDLVVAAAEWLRTDGWEVYFEVAPWGSGAARADIVGTRGPLLAVVECKLSLSLAVLGQCETWRRMANVVWAAVPKGNRDPFAKTVAAFIGAGIIQFGGYGGRDETLRPEFRRRTDDRLRKALNDAQKETAPGAAGGYSTPFRETCTRLLVAVKEAGGRIAVKQAMTGLRHHYSSAACARSSLIERTERGVVPGLRVTREGKAVFFEVTP